MNKQMPTEIKILDKIYTIEYMDKPSDVDLYKRDSLWGQVDYWTHSIRIYKTNRSNIEMWHTIWHEILHAICEHLKLDSIKKDEKIIDLLALGINSVISDNFRVYEYNEQEKRFFSAFVNSLTMSDLHRGKEPILDLKWDDEKMDIIVEDLSDKNCCKM